MAQWLCGLCIDKSNGKIQMQGRHADTKVGNCNKCNVRADLHKVKG